MTELKYALLCDYALVSQDGKVSIIGEFDRIYTSGKSATLLRGFLVAKIKGDPGREMSINIKIDCLSAKEDVFNTKLRLKLDEKGTSGLIIEIGNITFSKFGVYKILIQEEENLLGHMTLDIVKVPEIKAAKA